MCKKKQSYEEKLEKMSVTLTKEFVFGISVKENND